ncbi:hypothetical protein [Chitinophaga sancti]|uniref:Uncharacterized protein n=2 Tax=Chitinophaga sancti TaxID=1004 RepID=A0ABZ0XL49_9BACT|nr:hypothetical protein [Chitinophaga sancti]WQD63420.1 hypothetical protein U0033_03355 [Chitinophaga sancti]WQG90954.1 hypothetical protein SR876_05560 [Chitinophaga sancti]
MGKLRLYILMGLFTLHTISFDQLLKLPVLVAHYIEHRAQDGNLTVMQFLSMHYLSKDDNDNDQDRDNQLPFKKVNSATVHQIFTPLAKITNLKVQAVVNEDIQYPEPDEDRLPNPATSDLFRPPRV